MQLARHPLSALFAKYDLSGDALKELATDIRDNGQLQPITIHEGAVLDGWNRYKACQVFGTEPVTMELAAGSNPWEFVKGINMLRRHMVPAERVAVLLMKRQMEAVDNCTKLYAPTVSEVQADIDVSRGTANKAVKILKAADPELNQALADKRVSLEKAAKVADLPKAERKAAIEAAPEPHRKPEKAPETELATDALDEANERARELAVDLEAYMLAAGENGEAAKEIVRLNQKVDAITRSRDEYMTKCSELIVQVKTEQRKVKRLEDKLRALENAKSGGF